MDNTKLQEVIKQKNERRERQTLSDAEHLIENIIECQKKIQHYNAQIAEYRSQLKALEVEVLDPTAVLGE